MSNDIIEVTDPDRKTIKMKKVLITSLGELDKYFGEMINISSGRYNERYIGPIHDSEERGQFHLENPPKYIVVKNGNYKYAGNEFGDFPIDETMIKNRDVFVMEISENI